MDSVSFGLILINVVLGSIAQLLLKMGVNKAGKGASIVSIFTHWQVIIGFALYGMASILWLKILQNPNVSLSLAYPMISLSYIVVTVLDYYVLKDEVPLQRIIGLAIIFIGIVVMSQTATHEKKTSALPHAPGEPELAEVTLMDIPLPPAPAATPIPHHIPHQDG